MYQHECSRLSIYRTNSYRIPIKGRVSNVFAMMTWNGNKSCYQISNDVSNKISVLSYIYICIWYTYIVKHVHDCILISLQISLSHVVKRIQSNSVSYQLQFHFLWSFIIWCIIRKCLLLLYLRSNEVLSQEIGWLYVHNCLNMQI